jgi:hypothetical protein
VNKLFSRCDVTQLGTAVQRLREARPARYMLMLAYLSARLIVDP